jgi:quinol monooxygenase YgiN
MTFGGHTKQLDHDRHGSGKSPAELMPPTVAVFGTLRFPPENISHVLPHLQKLIEDTYRDDGCIAYDVAVDPFDPGLIRFFELWPNHEALAQHLTAPHIEPWRTVARTFGLLERKFVAYDITGSRAV